MIVVITADSPQSFGQFHLQSVDDGVAVKAKFAQLSGHSVDIMRVTVPDTDDGVSAIEVEIRLTFVVPHVDSLSPHDVYIEERVHIE